MKEPPLQTAFASAERAPRSSIEANIAALDRNELLRALLDVSDVSVVVLNAERQIIAGNKVLLESLGLDRLALVGLRPGEALGCIHSAEHSGGCGTSPHCAACGAVLAILESQRHRSTAERECLMTVRRGDQVEAYELAVKASHLELDGEAFTVVGLRDISAAKRRDALERLFLHDLSNTLAGLLGWARLINEDPAPPTEAARRVLLLAERMRREIEDQRVLLLAEKGTLETVRTRVEPDQVLQAAAALLEGHPVARHRRLEVARSGAASVETDESLLLRVLINMMKNALEATAEGGTVRAWASDVAGGCELRVRNDGVMTSQVALQIFKRSFSTKGGRGRGLGTFSMKLIGERYLGGTVGFSSSEGEGTTFTIRLPR